MKSKKIESCLILGEKTQIPYNSPESQGNNNVVVVGSSGKGKSSCVVIPNIMQGGANIVVSDPKGSILNTYGKELSKIYDIYFLNLKDFNYSMHYNPLKYIKNEEDILFVAGIIADNLSNGRKASNYSDSYWYNAKKGLITALISYVCKKESDEFVNMKTVMDLFSMIKPPDEDKSFFESDKNDEKEKNIQNTLNNLISETDNFTKSNYSIFCNNSPRTSACIYSEAMSALREWSLQSARNLVRYDESNLYQFVTHVPKEGERYKALFVIADDVNGEKNFLTTLFYSQVLQIAMYVADSSYDNKLQTPLRFYLDDFATVGRIPDLEKYISNIRSRNISVMLILQNESQLIDIYGDSNSRTIIGNCNYYVYMGSTDNYCKKEMMSRFSTLSSQNIYSLSLSDCLVDDGEKQYKDKKFYKKYEIESLDFCKEYFKTHPRPIEENNYFSSIKFMQENKSEMFDKSEKEPLYVIEIKRFEENERKDLAVSLQKAASKYGKFDENADYGSQKGKDIARENHKAYVDAMRNTYLEAQAENDTYSMDVIRSACMIYGIDIGIDFGIDIKQSKSSLIPSLFPILKEDFEVKKWWDSESEKVFFYELEKQVVNWNENHDITSRIKIETHVHLSEIFHYDGWEAYKEKDKFKLQNLHCDFILRKTDDNGIIISGIEVDGPCHEELQQSLNDEFKNELFKKYSLPLYRIQADFVWQQPKNVLAKKITKIIAESFDNSKKNKAGIVTKSNEPCLEDEMLIEDFAKEIVDSVVNSSNLDVDYIEKECEKLEELLNIDFSSMSNEEITDDYNDDNCSGEIESEEDEIFIISEDIDEGIPLENVYDCKDCIEIKT